eukprot:12917037-Prorocentrum_lima.AAC.1
MATAIADRPAIEDKPAPTRFEILDPDNEVDAIGATSASGSFVPKAPPMPPPSAATIFETSLPSYLTLMDDSVAARGGEEVELPPRQ